MALFNKIHSPFFKVLFSTLIICALLLGAGCTGSDKHAENNKVSETTVAHSHAKANETCFICDASKRDKGRLWCKEHSTYENRCWKCQPQLEDKERPYCKEHQVYEDECPLCNLGEKKKS